MTEPTPEELRAIEIARDMAMAGIPVFVCRPNPFRPGKFYIESGWPNTVADPAALDRWQPGYGVAAVGGGAADFLDMDPRSGGLESREILKNEGSWPLSFGQQSTPSGGTHDVISSAGIGKRTGFMPGLDFQGGLPEPDADGETHRAFVWLAPTVGRSKETGELVPYRWVHEPDLAALDEWRASDGTCTDESIRGIANRILAKPVRALPRLDVDEMDETGGEASSIFNRFRDPFTMEQAEEFVRPHLDALRNAKNGDINTFGMAATLAIEHFVPDFWSVEEASAIILENLSHTVYDPNGTSDWTADQQFIERLDGRRPVKNSWKAKRALGKSELARVFDIPGEDETPIPATSEEAQSLVQKLLGQMMTAEQMCELPAPVPLVWELLDRDSLAALTGAPGSFKSFVALDIAAHVSRGTPWHDLRTHRGPVIYIAAEGVRGMTLRIRAWRERYGQMGEIRFLPAPVQIRDAPAWQALVKACHLVQPVLVVVDTQAMVTVGVEENSNSEMGVAIEAFKRIQRVTGACVLVVHHLTKDGASTRGAGAQDGAQDTRIRVERLTPRSSLKMRLRDEKQKDMAESDEAGLALQLDVVDLGEDPVTGRHLSSLVINHDPYRAASGEEAPVDVGQAVKIREPQEWTVRITHPHALIQRRILQTLADLAPANIGLTEAKVKTLVAERWHEGKVGRRPGMLNSQSFQDGWTGVLKLKIETGESVVVPLSGQRYGLDPIVSDSL